MPPQEVSSAAKKILIIEDEAFLAKLYSGELIKAGFQVKLASDGSTGLQTLEAESFDLLLLDIMLPDINGLEILRQWRAKHPASLMPILLLTNLGQDDVIKEAFTLGAKGYLIKASYTPQQVVNEVISTLGSQTANPSPQAPQEQS